MIQTSNPPETAGLAAERNWGIFGRGRTHSVIKKILIGLVVLVAVLVAIVSLQPAQFRVERSTTVSAPAETVFAQVNNFRNWDAWSPWAKMDPDAKFSFEGPESGVGAIFRWSGNDKIGEGSNTITESVPGERVRINLVFIRPFEDTSTAEFTFKPEGENTVVTWSMFGENNFISKAFCLFMDMDKMVGGDFEKGLASLKAVAESAKN